MADSVTTAEYSFSHSGTCPVCEKAVTFSANGPYFRRTLKCSNCGCEPRHRAFMHILKQYFPDWENLRLHESSPGWDPVSTLLAAKNKHYIASQYDANVPSGEVVQAPRMPCRAYRSENLEAQTFADQSFDLVISLDVFEHIFHPDLAIKEIARTLKPGGATLMTVPIVQRLRRSQRRAALVNGEVKHILPAEFHGNPISGEGSIVTVDWGYDIVSYLQHHSALSFIMCQIDNIDLGIRADFNEILIGLKHPIPTL